MRYEMAICLFRAMIVARPVAVCTDRHAFRRCTSTALFTPYPSLVGFSLRGSATAKPKIAFKIITAPLRGTAPLCIRSLAVHIDGGAFAAIPATESAMSDDGMYLPLDFLGKKSD